MSDRLTGIFAGRPGPGRAGLPRWLTRGASILVIAAAAALASAGSASAASRSHPSARHGGTGHVLPGRQIAAYARTLVGRYPYTWGGTSPRTGFDCSGLTMYVYQRYGIAIPRTAQEQYLAFRKVSNGKAWRGDLVFFHDDTGRVYHVGIYEGPGTIVAAADPEDGIVREIIWSSAVTFGTLTHR
jgi:peptidoglycan DL-endopeptidase CwlO